MSEEVRREVAIVGASLYLVVGVLIYRAIMRPKDFHDWMNPMAPLFIAGWPWIWFVLAFCMKMGWTEER